MTAGALIASGALPAPLALSACALGIFVGDFALWLLGRLGGAFATSWPWLASRVSASRIEQGRRWLNRHAGRALVASRFTPGTRLPLYVTAGVVNLSPVRFAAWTLIASIVWTPTVVLASARAGSVVRSLGPSGVWPLIATAIATIAITRGAVAMSSRIGSLGVANAIRKYSRWEFWPSWLFYAPVALWVAALALRHRGIGALSACNPGIEDGGVVGESKFAILQRLPANAIIPSELLPNDRTRNPVHDALDRMKHRGWTFPIVVKPDTGQRGAGVRLVRSIEQLAAYVWRVDGPLLMQPYHAGPYEAGVFYYRFPAERRGRIFSITDKEFAAVIGDGVSTLEELIRAHPRYRLLAPLFITRHRVNVSAVLARGERFQLGIAGNHAQGAIFHDGAHLWTQALEDRIDAIARQYPGFFIGRFDIRYADVDEFKAGRDLAIVELNGATAESTNIYDPKSPLLSAYRTLFRQWSLVFEIGAANCALGAKPTPAGRLLHLIHAHLTTAPALPISD